MALRGGQGTSADSPGRGLLSTGLFNPSVQSTPFKLNLLVEGRPRTKRNSVHSEDVWLHLPGWEPCEEQGTQGGLDFVWLWKEITPPASPAHSPAQAPSAGLTANGSCDRVIIHCWFGGNPSLFWSTGVLWSDSPLQRRAACRGAGTALGSPLCWWCTAAESPRPGGQPASAQSSPGLSTAPTCHGNGARTKPRPAGLPQCLTPH